ncbi:hypothetical protein [Sediminitomix flava]|uniref:Uncharacterized protein n=1 Tax=Sediminitomix flava TaxID=379075 RepID=A0A315ZWZ5_SEDFL|nr:hypothetical protein [Sediminitomix flava]PWJ41847.1 hypothetical protein BC781_10397 [Sediminitomix flava]
MSIDVKQIQKNYELFSDQEIVKIATHDVINLAPEAVEILIQQIEKRNLDASLLESVKLQAEPLSEKEFNVYFQAITHMKCPECGEKNGTLQGHLIRKVMSFIVLTYSSKRPIICCSDCGESEKQSSLIKTFLLGWWGLPFGILKTPYYLISHFLDRGKLDQISDQIIADFIHLNYPIIRKNFSNEDAIQELVYHYNHKS